MPTTPESAPTAHAIRDDLIAALHADLIGPYAGREAPDAPEVLSLPPSRWYLSGFLAPELGREIDDPTQDDEDGARDELDRGTSHGLTADSRALLLFIVTTLTTKRSRLPDDHS